LKIEIPNAYIASYLPLYWVATVKYFAGKHAKKLFKTSEIYSRHFLTFI